jgi:Holliday junction resolvase RusA-like endonuclease
MKIFIPGNVPSSKNSRVWTGKFMVSSKAVNTWRKNTERYWEQYTSYWDLNDKRIYPIRLSMHFIRGNRHKFDYNNMSNTVLDEMVKYGWIPDDNADIVIPVFEPYTYDKKNPGVWLEIL